MCRIYDVNRHAHDLRIFLRDTVTLAAGGTPLAVLGEAHGLPKLNLPDGMIGKMDVLLRAEAPGVIAWIPVAVGMRVEAGDLLVELE
mgnify:CR=1 FL=1